MLAKFGFLKMPILLIIEIPSKTHSALFRQGFSAIKKFLAVFLLAPIWLLGYSPHARR